MSWVCPGSALLVAAFITFTFAFTTGSSSYDIVWTANQHISSSKYLQAFFHSSYLLSIHGVWSQRFSGSAFNVCFFYSWIKYESTNNLILILMPIKSHKQKRLVSTIVMTLIGCNVSSELLPRACFIIVFIDYQALQSNHWIQLNAACWVCQLSYQTFLNVKRRRKTNNLNCAILLR